MTSNISPVAKTSDVQLSWGRRISSKIIGAIRWFLGFRPTPFPQRIPQLSVTVIVPAYNEEASIARTIESILSQTHFVERIIVVDDCSSDSTNEIASDYSVRHPSVSVVRTDLNQGSKAMAQNYVLPSVETDLFVTIDGDTMLAPDAIEQTMVFFSEQNTAIVCGFVVPQKIKTFWERARFIEYLHTFSIMKPAQDHWGVLTVASGCFSVFRTHEVRDLLGGFKHRTLVEDMDLTLEAQEAGYRIAFANRALCFPVDPPTFRVMFDQLERWYRGFFQCIMVRGTPFQMFGQSKKMALTIYLYALWSLLSSLTVPLLGWYVTRNILGTVLAVFVSMILFVGIPVFIKAYKMGRLKEAIISFPAFLPLTYINVSIYAYAAWKEVIQRQHLNEWKKGH